MGSVGHVLGYLSLGIIFLLMALHDRYETSPTAEHSHWQTVRTLESSEKTKNPRMWIALQQRNFYYRFLFLSTEVTLCRQGEVTDIYSVVPIYPRSIEMCGKDVRV